MFGFNQQPNNGATGGLFGGGGNNNTQGGGGLFGGGAMGGAGGAGQSLFGGQNNASVSNFGNNQGGGLFGGGGQQNTAQVGGGLFGGGQQQQQQQNNGGGLFGGGGGNNGGGGLFGGATNNNNNNNQPSPFSLNGPSQGNGGLFGGAPQNSGGGLFGGGGSTFGQTQPNALGGNNNGMGGQTAQFGGFGGGMQQQQQQQQGGGLFGNNSNNGVQGQQPGGLFGGPVASTGGGLFGGQQQAQQSGGGLFGQPAQNNNAGGGLFGMTNNNNNATGGLFGGGGAATSGGGLLGGGFNMGNNNGGLLGGLNNNNQGNTGFGGFNNQMAGSFGQNNNNATQPFVAKKSVNESLSSKPNEKNLVYSISNGSDKCILELALIQRKMVKAGQLQPNPQGAMGQNLGQPQQQGGLFGGNQNMQQPGAVGGGLFGAAPQQQQGGLFGGQPAATSQPLGGGGLFGQAKPAQSVSFGGGLFGQSQQNTTGGLLGNATGGGGLFGQTTQAPAQSGGLFGGAGLGSQPAPATGGGLFGGQPTQPAGGLFGGQTQQPAQGGLFGAQPAATTTGGLFGGATAAPAQTTGFSLGGASSTGGLFGNSAATTQQGGLFGGSTQQTGGLFGAPAQPSGGLFGQTAPSGGLFGNTNPSAAQTGGQFGQLPLPSQGLQFGGAGPQNSDSIGGYQSLLRFLEATNFQEQKKPILDEDIEARWVYGKARDSDSLGYYQKREGDKQGESAYTANEYQSLYGYSQKQKVLSQFKNLALKDENDRKEDIKKTLSAFTGGNQSDMSNKLKTQSNMSSGIPAKSERLSSSTLGANPQELTQQMEYCIDFIKSGSKSRVKIPFKPRYTYGDVKNYILEQIIDTDATLEGVRQFRLQARLKEANQPPKPLKETEKILGSTIYSSIDYIELVEKAGNLTSSLNNSVAFGQNVLEASQLSEKNNQENDDKIIQNSSSSAAAAPAPKKFTIPSEFKTSPSISVLEKLGDSALQRVENFSIENSFVKITFEEPINLLNADLTGLIFGENKISIEDVPSGDRINKPCVIQFMKFGQKQLDNKKTPLEVQNLVEKLITKMNLDLVKPYDVKNTCLIYRQENFN